MLIESGDDALSDTKLKHYSHFQVSFSAISVRLQENSKVTNQGKTLGASPRLGNWARGAEYRCSFRCCQGPVLLDHREVAESFGRVGHAKIRTEFLLPRSFRRAATDQRRDGLTNVRATATCLDSGPIRHSQRSPASTSGNLLRSDRRATNDHGTDARSRGPKIVLVAHLGWRARGLPSGPSHLFRTEPTRLVL